MCTEYRQSVSPENIVVRYRNNRGTLYNNVPQVPWYALHRNSYAELLRNKELMERRSKKGIALMNIASNVHFTAGSAMP